MLFVASGKKRRAWGTGSISPRKDGRFGTQLKLPDWDGSILRLRTTKNTEFEADRWLTQQKYEHERNIMLAKNANRITVAEYLQTWLTDAVEGTVSRHTYRDYHDKVHLHLIPAIGKVRLQELTTRHLQTLYRKKTEEGLGPASIRYIHATIRKALDQAEGWDLVRKNVAKWAKPPKPEHKEKVVLSVDEAKTFLRSIQGDRLEPLYLLAVTTGMRRGEMLGLKWTDIDLGAGTLKVSRSLDTYYGPAAENNPKRAASRRPAGYYPSRSPRP